MSTRDAYVQKLQAQLDLWEAQIDQLRARAGMAEADSKIELNKKIDDLEDKRTDVKGKLAELREAGEGTWEDLKEGVDNAWSKLGDAVKSVTSRFS